MEIDLLLYNDGTSGYAAQHVPEVQTDFIFAAIAEQWGFIGVVFIIDSLWNSNNSDDKYSEDREGYLWIRNMYRNSCLFLVCYIPEYRYDNRAYANYWYNTSFNKLWRKFNAIYSNDYRIGFKYWNEKERK